MATGGHHSIGRSYWGIHSCYRGRRHDVVGNLSRWSNRRKVNGNFRQYQNRYAGLFILFFAFAIIVYVLASLSSSHVVKSSNVHSPPRVIGIAFFSSLGSCVAAGTLGALGYGTGFGFFAFMLGFLTVGIGIAYLVSVGIA